MSARGLASAATLAIVLGAAVAAAEPLPKLASLPGATVPAPPAPREAPKSLPVRSVADGLLVSRDPNQHLGVVVTPAPSAQGACVSLGAQADLSVVSSADARWVGVRMQRIVTDERGARLVTTDAWIDALSLASREAARYESPLQTMLTSSGGLKVYGFRDGALLRAFVPLDFGGSVQPAQGAPHTVTCRFASVNLDTAAEGGEVAIVVGETEVPVTPLSTKTKRRGVQISLSTSRTASDESPVLSATVAWVDSIHMAVTAAPIVGD